MFEKINAKVRQPILCQMYFVGLTPRFAVDLAPRGDILYKQFINLIGKYTMSTQMIVRIDPELKARVTNLAKAEGKTISEVVRELLEDYVRNRDIGSYIDDLWKRIGTRLKSRRIGPKDIQRVIQEVRAKSDQGRG